MVDVESSSTWKYWSHNSGYFHQQLQLNSKQSSHSAAFFCCLSEFKASRRRPKEALQTKAKPPPPPEVIVETRCLELLPCSITSAQSGPGVVALSLKACLCCVTSGCSQRSNRPISAEWWRSCSNSSLMRCSTWTPAPSAVGHALWWGTRGT